jgi:adenylate cyclase
MNRLLTPLTSQILENNGTIDKYMGDAVMAFWNAPLRDADHARHACLAALGLQAALVQLNRELAEEAAAGTAAVTFIKVGIGINSGLCVVGNMGSEQRFDYSVLGDSVNLASRLEGQCSVYGADIILGQATVALVGDSALSAELDLIRVKGKREPQRIFALLGGGDMTGDGAVRGAIATMENVLTAYRCQSWDAAIEAVDALAGHRLTGLDLEVFARLYRERVEDFRRQPPPPDWDGVYTAVTK